jgi:hypothetical protein
LDKGHPVGIRVRFRRFVNWKDPDRTPERIASDEIIMKEASSILDEIILELSQHGHADSRSKTLREMKAFVNPAKARKSG